MTIRNKVGTVLSAIGNRLVGPSRYFDSSLGTFHGRGAHGQKSHPWNPTEAVDPKRSFNAWVAVAARINARGLAAVPLRLYVRKREAGALQAMGLRGIPAFRTRPVSNAKKKYLLGDARLSPSSSVLMKFAEVGDEFEEVVDLHPAMELLRTVNPFWNGFDFTEYRALHWQLTGNAYMHPVFNAMGVPQTLWPMPSHWTWVIPDRERWIRGYAYGENQATVQEFGVDEVIHWKRANPYDLFYGMGWVQEAWPAICLHHAKRSADTALFENGARPDYAVIFNGPSFNDDQLKRFERRVGEQLRGTRKSGNMLALSNATVTPMTFPPKDLGDQSEIVEEIAGASGVPITMLKANDPNLASSQTGYASWREMTILPMCGTDEQALNAGYLTLWGDDFAGNAILAYDNPVPADEAASVTRRATLVRAGIMTLNEARAEDGLPAYEPDVGDVARINGTSVSQVDNPPSPFPFLAGGGGGVSPSPIPALPPAVSDEPANPLDRFAPKSLRASWMKAMDVRVKDDRDQPQEGLGEVDAFRRSMSRVFGRIADSAASAINGATSTTDAQRRLLVALSGTQWPDEIVEAARPFIEQAIGTGGVAGMDRIGSDLGFDVTNPRVQEFVDQYTVRLAREIHGTTQIRLFDLFGEGLNTGTSIGDLSKILRDWGGDDVSGPRAEMIARTESARAYVEGQEAAWKESGVVQGKFWLLAPEPCEFCRAVANQFNEKSRSPTPLGSPFLPNGSVLRGTEGGTMRLDYDPRGLVGPPLHPQCRCDLVPVLRENP